MVMVEAQSGSKKFTSDWCPQKNLIVRLSLEAVEEISKIRLVNSFTRRWERNAGKKFVVNSCDEGKHGDGKKSPDR